MVINESRKLGGFFMSELTIRKKMALRMKFPHQLIIIIAIVFLAMIATWLIPAGTYSTIDINGRKAIDASSFSYVEKSPVSIWDALLSLPRGYIKNIKIIVMVMVIAGSMSVINATRAFDASVGKIAARYKDNLNVIIPLLLGLFSILGTMGINTPIIAFVPLGLLLGRNLGGDNLVGVALAVMGMTAGLAGGAFCTSSTVVAQTLAGLPVFSGWQLRIAATVVFWLSGSIFLIRYTRKVQSDPSRSILYGAEGIEETVVEQEVLELSPRRVGSLIAFLIGFGIVVYGALNGMSTADEMPIVFLLTAVACGLIYGFSANDITKEFVKGVKNISGALLVIGCATGIGIVLDSGKVLHTIVHGLAGLFENSTGYIAALGMYVSNLLINFPIVSSSGQAAVVIPIFSGMADILGLTQQSVVQAFNFGDALTNMMSPVSGVMMASIGIGGIALDRWYKFIWKWIAMWCCIAVVFVIIGVAINYGPF